MDISIIIVSYNTKDLLKNSLDSVIKTISSSITFEIIVVDNDSKDGSVEMVKKEFPSVILIENKENYGFSKANNLGTEKSKGRYVLFLNSDTIAYDDAIETVFRFMEENKKVGAATCKLVMPNKKMDDACHRGFPTPWNAFCHFLGFSKLFPKTKLFGGYNLTYLDITKVHEIDALAGAFMMVRRIAGEEVSWWDEDYFWYGEDLDFCYNLKEKGWKIYFIPYVSILHYKGASGGLKKESQSVSKVSKETKKKATKARFEAMRIFYRKHYLRKYPKILTGLVMTGINLREKLG